MVIEIQRGEYKLAKDLIVKHPTAIDPWLAEPIFKVG